MTVPSDLSATHAGDVRRVGHGHQLDLIASASMVRGWGDGGCSPVDAGHDGQRGGLEGHGVAVFEPGPGDDRTIGVMVSCPVGVSAPLTK